MELFQNYSIKVSADIVIMADNEKYEKNKTHSCLPCRN